jgi:hypothetical protein
MTIDALIIIEMTPSLIPCGTHLCSRMKVYISSQICQIYDDSLECHQRNIINLHICFSAPVSQERQLIKSCSCVREWRLVQFVLTSMLHDLRNMLIIWPRNGGPTRQQLRPAFVPANPIVPQCFNCWGK